MAAFDPFNPTTAVELAKTFFAGISAVAASVSAWNATRSKNQAAQKFDETFLIEVESEEADLAAREILHIMPKEALRALEKRAENCWNYYRNVLDPDRKYMDDEIDNATEGVQSCVCRELRRIYKLNGHIPARWETQWNHYNCLD